MARSRSPSKGGGARRGKPPRPRKPYEIKRLPRKPYERQKAYEARKAAYHKAEYAKRKERGLALGRTLQAARGHQPKEHVLRKIDPKIRKEIRAAIREQSKRDIVFKEKRAEIARTQAIKDLYKQLQNIFSVLDEEEGEEYE